jgi:hypothetical protein
MDKDNASEAVNSWEAKELTALDSDSLGLLSYTSSCFSSDISLYLLSNPSQACLSNIERFILSQSIFEAIAAASTLLDVFFCYSLI